MKMFLVLIVAIGLATFCLPSSGDSAAAKKDTDPGTKSEAVHYTYVIVHGASGGGWDWRTMDELLTAGGHTVYRPTLTGLGEKMHLANADINLTTHIDDIANVILFEDLDEVVLVGHSYGGMVITNLIHLLGKVAAGRGIAYAFHYTKPVHVRNSVPIVSMHSRSRKREHANSARPFSLCFLSWHIFPVVLSLCYL